MSFSVGIIGLPNVGKSTLFKALTRQPVNISNYPFSTISPNVGIVQVPDLRLEKIAEIVKPKKITPAIIEFVDIAGLVKDAHKGEGLGNQFLARIREVDAILEVVRAFEDEKIEHIEKTVNPERDIEIIKTELLMKDLETIEKNIENFKAKAKSQEKETIKKLELLETIKNKIGEGRFIFELEFSEDFKKIIKELCLLTAKPIIYVFNTSGDNQIRTFRTPGSQITIDLKMTEEISELSPREIEELKLESKIGEIIKLCYQALDLITFYTIKGGEESRAWTLKRNENILEAAGKVHTDFKEKFIKAEVINFEKFLKAGSWTKARENGWLEIAGKDYIVRDGDIIEFKI